MWKTHAVAFQNLSKCHWRSEALVKKEKDILPLIDDEIKWPFLTQTGQELGQAKWQLFASLCLYDIGIMCIFCTPQPIYRSTYRLIVNRCIGRYIDWCSTYMSVNISTDTRLICWPRYVGWHIVWYIGWLSSNTWLIHWSICCARGYQHFANTSLILSYW